MTPSTAGLEQRSADHGGARSDALSPRVLVAAVAPTRQGIRIVLGDAAGICAEAGDSREAIRTAKAEQPEIALIERELPGDWHAAVRGVCRAAPRCATVVLAQCCDVDDMLDSIRAGAVGYVPGPLDPERLQRVITALRANEAVVPRAMIADLLSELRGAGAGADRLTGREAQVLGMVRRGHSTAWIAERLQIAPVTVRRHISELVAKLGVESRTELVEQAPT